MEESKRRTSLGRGLSALFGEAADDVAPPDPGRPPRAVPIEFVHPGRFQPRKRFDPEGIQSLVDSVRERGILQPLLVRRHPDSATEYELIAGERRWRAAQIAGLHEVPVVVRELTDREALEIALVENIQRQDLTPLEEAEGYRRLMEEFGHTQEVLARSVGKSRSHVANMLRLLTLPDPLKEMVNDGRLTAGHARALLGVPDSVAIAQDVVARGLNVRQAEQLAREAQAPKADAVTAAGRAVARAVDRAKDPDTLALEQDLTNRLGLRVKVSPQGAGGTVTIQYQNLDQLDEVIRRLSESQPA
jgi:ParB family chromosome partitioning protein